MTECNMHDPLRYCRVFVGVQDTNSHSKPSVLYLVYQIMLTSDTSSWKSLAINWNSALALLRHLWKQQKDTYKAPNFLNCARFLIMTVRKYKHLIRLPGNPLHCCEICENNLITLTTWNYLNSAKSWTFAFIGRRKDC